MKRDDHRIEHLRNLGEDRTAAIRTLEEGLRLDPNFLERAEISHSHETRDSGLLHTELGYVAGICGNREARNQEDLVDDVYSLVYFQGKTQQKDRTWKPEEPVFTNSLACVVDYKPLKAKLD